MTKRHRKFKPPRAARAPKAGEESGDELIRRAIRERLVDPKHVVVQYNTTKKLSEAIIDMAQPVLDVAGNEGARNVLNAAVAIWNMMLLPEPEQQKELARLLRAFRPIHEDDEEMIDALLADIELMMERRQSRHAHDRRFVLEYEIADRDDMINLRVLGEDLDHPTTGKL